MGKQNHKRIALQKQMIGWSHTGNLSNIDRGEGKLDFHEFTSGILQLEHQSRDNCSLSNCNVVMMT